MAEPLKDIGVIGLAVMGGNLARNLASRKLHVCVYNRTKERTDEYAKAFGSSFLAATYSVAEFVASLKRPRKIIIMVKAGEPVDAVIAELLPFLEAGDIVIDGGNSFYRDTQRREKDLAGKKMHFVGMGVSGGEEGALHGPSIMPGGSVESWKSLQPILEAIAAKDFSGNPCVAHIGANGAGHYVKMVHNGIEYAVMQLMAEAYAFLTREYELSANQVADIFETFGKGKLHSYLFAIALPVLRRTDDLARKGNLVDVILDQAGSKGTGQWASVDALGRGVSIASITEAVFARYVSANKAERLAFSKLYPKKNIRHTMSLKKFTALLENALYAAMISCYAQGYDLIQKTAAAEGWQVDLAEVSRIWEGGCIIRAKLLNVLHEAYLQSGQTRLALLAIPRVRTLMKKYVPDLRTCLSVVALSGSSAPALASALFYFQDMTTARLPANFIQGLRDFFGAHTYERTDRPGTFHTEW